MNIDKLGAQVYIVCLCMIAIPASLWLCIKLLKEVWELLS